VIVPETSPASRRWNRIRHWAPVRIICFVAALVLVLIAINTAARAVIPPASLDLRPDLLTGKNLLVAVAMLGAYALLVRGIEHRRARELDIRRGVGPLGIGLLVGAGLMGSVYLVLWALGLARFDAGTGWSGIGVGLISALTAAVFEELLLRAVLFRILEEVGGTTVAVILSAATFGALHGANPGATAFSMIAIAIEAGILLALAYALTRNLWLAVGIHMGWNFAEGSVFGAEVSGSKEAHSLFSTVLTGPKLLTGGAFGPEASIVSLVACLMVAAAIALMIQRRGGWRPARFRMRLS
jgi:membrane protease YdiL (CAAX protease family)